MLVDMNTSDIPAIGLHRLRRKALALIDAFEATPQPETHAEILRATRTLMALDKMLKQLWPIEAHDDAETAAVEEPARPLNRRERRALEAIQRMGRTVAPGMHTAPA